MQTRAQAAPLITSLGLVGFVVLADTWVVSPIVPAISRDIGVSPVRTTAIITAFLLPLAVFQLICGILADRYGKLRVIRVALVGFTIMCGLSGLGMGLTDLIVFRGLTGVFASAAVPVSLALISDTVRMEERQEAIGSFLGISFLGQGLSMAIGGAIAFLVSWRGVFLTYSTLSAAVTALLIIRTRRLAPPTNHHGEIAVSYKRLLTQGRSLRVYLIVIFVGALVTGGFSFLGAFLSHQFSVDNLAIGVITTAFGVAAIVAGRTSGTIAGRVGRRRSAAMGLLIAALGEAMISLMSGFLPAVIIGIALLGGGFMLTHSTMLTLASEFAAKARGAAMSLLTFCLMSGGALGTALGGMVIDGTSLVVFYGIWAGLLFALSVVSYFAVTDTLAIPTPIPATAVAAE